jgi:predicted dehydrogenase
MKNPIRIGIIGAGNVLEAYVPQCEKLRSRGFAELAVVCGREGQRERALRMGTPKFTTIEAEVLEDPK